MVCDKWIAKYYNTYLTFQDYDSKFVFSIYYTFIHLANLPNPINQNLN